jgi:hypothetical protein
LNAIDGAESANEIAIDSCDRLVLGNRDE